MRTRFSPVLVLVLALFLFTVPAQAAPRGMSQTDSPRLLARLVTLVKSLPARLVSVWEKEGSGVDPFGRTAPAPPEDPETNPSNTGPGFTVDS